MRIREIIADLTVADLDSARDFYADYLGLSDEEFNLGWVARHTARGHRHKVELVTRDATAPENPVLSIKVDDVEAAYADAQERGYVSRTP